MAASYNQSTSSPVNTVRHTASFAFETSSTPSESSLSSIQQLVIMPVRFDSIYSLRLGHAYIDFSLQQPSTCPMPSSYRCRASAKGYQCLIPVVGSPGQLKTGDLHRESLSSQKRCHFHSLTEFIDSTRQGQVFEASPSIVTYSHVETLDLIIASAASLRNL